MSKKRNYTPEQRRQIVAAVTNLIVRINGIITEVSFAESVLYRDDPWNTAVKAATSHLDQATKQLAIIATDVDKESCWPIQLAAAINAGQDEDEESRAPHEPQEVEPIAVPAAVAPAAKDTDKYEIGPLPPLSREALSWLNRTEEVRCAIHAGARAAGEHLTRDDDLERIEEGFSEVTSGLFDMFANAGLRALGRANQPGTSGEDQPPPSAA